jgi:hypothetical protein
VFSAYAIERTIAWLHGFRRLGIRCERRDDVHEAFLGLAVCLITHRHVALSHSGFLEGKANAALLGPPGVGRTHIAVALPVAARRTGDSMIPSPVSLAVLVTVLAASVVLSVRRPDPGGAALLAGRGEDGAGCGSPETSRPDRRAG